jgi:photosystem II stability/assembly factor-like uncharacterized protein
MFKNNRGWAVGNGDYHILRTYDGGQIWEDVSPVDLTFEGDTNKPSMYYHFLDAETGWVALSRLDSTFLFHTIDSGESWEQSALQFSVSDLFFPDQQNGFILTDLGAAAGSHYVAIYGSADAGKTWDLQFTHEPGASLSLPEGGSKSGFTFLDAQNGWVTGSAPIENSIYLYRTNNRAQNWEQAFCIPPDSVSGGFFESRPPKFIDNLVGFLPLRALTPAGESRGLFCVTEDGGEKWTATAVLSVFEEFDFVDGQHGWVAGPEGLFRTTDGGNSWVDLTSSAPSDMFMMQIDFIDPQTGWFLVSTDPAMKEGVRLLKTVDGGVTWNLVITRLVDDSN